jgi:hypothetical protein
VDPDEVVRGVEAKRLGQVGVVTNGIFQMPLGER